MSRLVQRFGAWLLAQATWRNVMRVVGLGVMCWLIIPRNAHPDPTSVLAAGAMMGLPSFLDVVQFIPRGGKRE